MPELPEVETIRRGLIDRIVGLQIERITINAPKLFRGDPDLILHQPITDIRRIAKVLVIDLANNYSLLVHFKMTGQLVFVGSQELAIGGHPEKAYQQPLPHKYTHLIYQLSNQSTLYYNDLRKFGWHRVVPSDQVKSEIGPSLSGVDILSTDFTLKYFSTLPKIRPKKSIKELILDQSLLAGLGNIYAAEALWLAKVRPDRLANSLSDRELSALYKAIKKVIALSLKYGGSSFNSYVNATGEQGTYLQFAQVYRKEQDSKGHTIQRLKQGGRTTHYCPICQL